MHGRELAARVEAVRVSIADVGSGPVMTSCNSLAERAMNLAVASPAETLPSVVPVTLSERSFWTDDRSTWIAHCSGNIPLRSLGSKGDEEVQLGGMVMKALSNFKWVAGRAG
jgi:hypothetical protein